jgi:hypothetical protein
MKPHEYKELIPIDDDQMKFLEFIRTQFRNGKYKNWNAPEISNIAYRLKTINQVIKRGSYSKNSSVHRTLINIRSEYNDYFTEKYTNPSTYTEPNLNESKNPCAEIYLTDSSGKPIQF